MSGIARDPVQFAVEELALLFNAKENELANELMLLNEKNRSLTDSILTYSNRRLEYGDIVLTSGHQAVAIRQIELQDMATQICVALAEDFEFSLQTIDKIAPAFQRALGESDFMTLKIAAGGAARLAKFKQQLTSHNL